MLQSNATFPPVLTDPRLARIPGIIPPMRDGIQINRVSLSADIDESSHLRRLALAVMTVSFLCGLFLPVVDAQAQARDRRDRESEPMYSVVKVGDDVRVVLSAEVRGLVEWENQRYRQAVEDYKRKRAAQKDLPAASELTKPERRTVKVVVKSVRGKEAADVRRERYLARQKGWSSGSFVVIDLAGEFRITTKADLADLRRSIDEEYKRLCASHTEAKKQAKRDRVPFADPAPTKPKVRVAPRTFTTELEAQIYVREYLAAREQKRGTNRADAD